MTEYTFSDFTEDMEELASAVIDMLGDPDRDMSDIMHETVDSSRWTFITAQVEALLDFESYAAEGAYAEVRHHEWETWNGLQCAMAYEIVRERVTELVERGLDEREGLEMEA